jgi:hypothetical protein
MRNLSTKGLSMSQAQSISNLCNQAAQNIANELDAVNNASKTFRHDRTDFTYVKGIPLPKNVKDLLLKKSKYHACQAFLMEATKAKENELERLSDLYPEFSEEAPERVYLDKPEILSSVSESWGWDQLSDKEIAEYQEVEAYASHIGQFIHRNGKLSILRRELSNLPALEFINIKDNEKTPVLVSAHHESLKLNQLHDELAKLHREYEQRVNYYKAKVKNLVSDENARIHRVNNDVIKNYQLEQDKLDREYVVAYDAYNARKKAFFAEFEAEREGLVKTTAQLRIVVDPRFQDVVDEFLTKSED